MGSVGNFWKNLNSGNNDKDDDKPEVLPEASNNENAKPLTTTTDEEIDALINSLEKVGQQSETKDVNVAKQEEKPVTFNTDLFKKIASEQDETMKNTNANTIGGRQKKEQTVRKTKKESQVDKVMETGKKATIITKSTIIAGNISTEDDLIIDGSVCGDVDCKGELTISGEVAGNAIAASINIKTSKFDGDVRSDGKIEINEGTVVLGNIYGKSATIAGAVKGEIIVSEEAYLEPTAIVKGNIRAKSVQIEHGAVLQGFCELAYESMDLDDFFGEVATDEAVEVEAVAEEINDAEEVNVQLLNKITNQAEDVVEVEETLESIEETGAVEELEEVEVVEEANDSDELELELEDDQDNKKEFMQEMENNYSNFMDQLKIDGDN